MSIILGIDPGTRATGFGVLEVVDNQSPIHGEKSVRAISHGVIRLNPEHALCDRLLELSQNLATILEKHRPHYAAIEKIFLGKNVDSVFKLGHARGVIMAECTRSGATVFEYATRKIKQSLTGNGNAGKEDVKRMVQMHLRLGNDLKMQSDASDALALALHQAFQVLNSGHSALTEGVSL